MKRSSFRLESGSDHIAAETLRVNRFEGREAIGVPFVYRIEVAPVAGEDHAPQPERWLGASLCLVMRPRLDLATRRVWGMVERVEEVELGGGRRQGYCITLVPRAKRLDLVATQDVFTDVSVPELIARKAALVGLTDAFASRLVDTYAQRSFIVQYRETDLAFVSRLAEHHGVSLVFEQQGDSDGLALVDHAAGFRLADEPIAYESGGAEGPTFELRRERRLLPQFYGVQDYNPSTPDADVAAIADIEGGLAGGIAEYAPHVDTAAEAQWLATVRAEEVASRHDLFHGATGATQVAVGERLTFTGHPRFGQRHLLITSMVVEGEEPIDVGDESAGPRYQASFTGQDAERPYRPPRRTPKPRIFGVVPGVVAPNSDGSLHAPARVDDRGRYTVKLLFDAAERPALRASTPVRMAQPFAGAGDGMHFPLRPGVEVALAFVDGDPDRPLILGAVPNAVTPSPVTSHNAGRNRVRSEHGVLVEFGDAVIPTG